MFSISDGALGALTEGQLPLGKTRLVQAWIRDTQRGTTGRLGTCLYGS
ncbi:hypothetical protein [Candidatus Magnetominusculus xianensis]